MSNIDFDWLQTNFGVQILQSVKYNGKLRNFGLLEKPTNTPTFQYEEISFKISLIGKSCVGKTSLIEALCYNKACESSIGFDNNSEKKSYMETPGIQITHLFWPAKIMNSNKYLMLNLSMWDVGAHSSAKYDYIYPNCEENLDCYLFIFSWTDKQSFEIVLDNIKQIDIKKTSVLVIGTKFDQIVQSEIEQDMIDELETYANTKIVRFSTKTCAQDQIHFIMNRLSELLLSKRLHTT